MFHPATHTNTLRVGSTCCTNCNNIFGVNKLLTGLAEPVTATSYSAWQHKPITLRPCECFILAAKYPGKSVNDQLLPSDRRLQQIPRPRRRPGIQTDSSTCHQCCCSPARACRRANHVVHDVHCGITFLSSTNTLWLGLVLLSV